ncbi:MAG: DUF4345 domain-containing protein [Cyanobacteria bacterium P01_C01_bin.69]
MNTAKFLVYATGLFFVFYGVAFTFLPVEMSSLVTGGSPSTPSGIIDLRATYGGMSIAMGATILILGFNPELVSLGLLVVAVILLAMAGARTLGIILDGTPNLLMYSYLAAELLFAGFALYTRKGDQGGGSD